MNWQGEQVCSVLAQRLLSSPWVQRLQITGTGIGWFVGLTIVSIPAKTVLIRDPHPIRQRRVGTIPSSVVGSIRVGPSVHSCSALPFQACAASDRLRHRRHPSGYSGYPVANL